MSGRSHVVMDLRNFVSWFSLLKITQVFEGMNTSEILEIRGADEEMRDDLLRILPRASYRLIKAETAGDGDGFGPVLIQKTSSMIRRSDRRPEGPIVPVEQE